MKEKLLLFTGLSLLICLTVYKKSISEEIHVLNNESIESSQLDKDIITEPTLDNVLYSKIDEDNNKCKETEVSTDQLEFSEAFKYYRNCNHDIFKWKGIEYTTILKIEADNDMPKSNLVSN